MYVSVNFFFFFREVLVDNLLPAAVAASCSPRQWEKDPGRRVGRTGAAAGGGKRLHLSGDQVYLKKKEKKAQPPAHKKLRHAQFCNGIMENTINKKNKHTNKKS